MMSASIPAHCVGMAFVVDKLLQFSQQEDRSRDATVSDMEANATTGNGRDAR